MKLTPQQKKGRAELRASAPVPVQTKKPTTHQVYSKKKGLIITPSVVTNPVKPPKGVFTNPTTGVQTDAQGNTITGYNQYGVAQTDGAAETQDDNRSIQDRAKSYAEGQMQQNTNTAADLGLAEDTPYYTSLEQETRDQINAQKAQRAQQEASYNYQQQASEYQTGQAKNYLESQSQAQAAQLAGGGNGPTSLSNLDLSGKIKSFNQQKIEQAIAAQNDTKVQLDQARANLKLAEKQNNTALIQQYQQELDNAQMAVEQADTDYYNSLTSASEEQRKQQDQQATNLNTFADLVGNGVTLDSQTIMSMAQQFGLPSDMLQAYYDGADNIRNDKTLDAQTKQVQLDQLKQNLSDQVAGLNTEAAKNLDTYKRLVQSGADPDTIAAFKQLAGITDYNDPFTQAELKLKQAQAQVAQNEADGVVVDPIKQQELVKAQYENWQLMGYTPGVIPEGGSYGVTSNGDGSVSVNVAPDFPAGQCGEFVNDVFGKGMFADSYASKAAWIDPSIKVPEAGMAFVMQTESPYGHVGIVESVDPETGMMTVVDSNWSGDEKVQRRTIPISSVSGFVKPPKSMPADAAITLDAVDKDLRSAVTTKANQFDAEPMVRNFQTIQEGKNYLDSLDPNNLTSSDNQSIIYAFAKIMDPNSVVRESEYETVQRYAQSLASTYGFNAERILANTEFLTPEAVQNMIKTVQGRYDASKQSYDQFRKEYVRSINNLAGGVNIGESILQNYITPQEDQQVVQEQQQMQDWMDLYDHSSILDEFNSIW